MGIVEQVTGVFTDMMEWIGGSFTTIESLFYNAETGLTFLGILSVCALGIGVFLLVMNIVRSFLQFR